jgi:hypothetical protein
MFVNGSGQNLKFKTVTTSDLFSSPYQRQCELLPSLGVRRLSSVNFSHFNMVHLAKRFQRRRILKISQSETRVACGSQLEMYILGEYYSDLALNKICSWHFITMSQSTKRRWNSGPSTPNLLLLPIF